MSCNGCLIFSTCYDKYPIDLKPPCASKNFERNDSGGVAAKPDSQQPQQSICRKCSGKGYNVSLVGDWIGVQHISEKKRKCRYCNGSGKQLAVR